MNNLTTLILPIHEHTIFHLFVFSLISFYQCLRVFTMLRDFSIFFTSLVKFFTKYFYSFWCYCKWNCFIFQIIHCWCIEIQLIYVYSSCVLQFYWICLLVLAVLRGFFGILLIYNTLSSANRDSVISSFPIWIRFIYFFLAWLCWLRLAITC